MPKILLMVAGLIGLAAMMGSASAQQPAGKVAFFKVAPSAFDRYIEDPDVGEQQWMLDHYARLSGFSPYLDRALPWADHAWFYKDAYAIKPSDPEFRDHPEWILRDANGRMLYIPFACSNGRCPQFAGDIGNPAFRAHWIAEAEETMSRGYRGIWIDDMNLTWRVSDGRANHVTPIDPRTGRLMRLEDWRRYFAEFAEEVRRALPNSEIAHNIIWFAGDRDNTDPYISRQIDAADYINLERGAMDLGLTGGNGEWSLRAFLRFVDFVHDRGSSVIFLDESTTTRQRNYSLAGWLAISSGTDLIGSESHAWTRPDDWWPGYDLDLGEALGPRFEWQGLIRRDFECGMVLLSPPDDPPVSVQLGTTFTTVDGVDVSAVTLRGDQSSILLDHCADEPPADDSPASVRLTLGETDAGSYGNGFGSDAHPSRLAVSFTGAGEDLWLSLRGYDIDVRDEVSVHLNGAFVGHLARGANNRLNAGQGIHLPALLQRAGENTLEFRLNYSGWTWGVTALLLERYDAMPVDVTLVPGTTDTGAYGHRYGSDEHRDSLSVGFQSTGRDLVLSLRAFDIDGPREVSVRLNRTLVGHLRRGRNNGLSSDSLRLPSSLQRAGRNELEFRQLRDGWVWGVTQLRLD